MDRPLNVVRDMGCGCGMRDINIWARTADGQKDGEVGLTVYGFSWFAFSSFDHRSCF